MQQPGSFLCPRIVSRGNSAKGKKGAFVHDEAKTLRQFHNKDLLPTGQRQNVRLAGDSKLSVGVNGRVTGFSLVIDLFRMYPGSLHMAAGIGSSPITTLNWISGQK